MSPTLGYWDVRGLGQPIRHLLAYLGVDYEDKVYVFTTPPHSKEPWLAVKDKLGLDFPNLPYWQDGDVKLTESKAILRHVARVYDSTSTILPKDSTLAYKADMVENIIFEAMIALATFAFTYDPSKQVEVFKGLNERFVAISKFLGNNKWIAGDTLTFADFWLYEAFIWYTTFEKDFLKPYANLQELKKRFEDIPSIKKYMSQPSYIKGPCINPMAKKPF